MRHHVKIGASFLQEEFDDLTVIIHLGLDPIDHPVLCKPGVMDTDRPPDKKKGHNGAYQGNQDELAVEPGVIKLP